MGGGEGRAPGRDHAASRCHRGAARRLLDQRHSAGTRLDWWHGFRSRELTEIIDNANVANLDIAAAVARIVQADAQSRIAGAALLPQVDLNGRYRCRTSDGLRCESLRCATWPRCRIGWESTSWWDRRQSDAR